MSITLTSQNKEEYLLIEAKGSMKTREDLIAQSQMLYYEIISHGSKKILIDETETIFPLDLFLYFGLIQEYLDNFPHEIRSLKIAIVTTDEYKEVAASWEALCQSRGLQYFAFTSLQDAVNCLVNE